MKSISLNNNAQNVLEVNSLLVKKGVAVIPTYLNNEEVEKLLEEFEELINAEKTKFSTPIDYSSGQGTKVFLPEISKDKYPLTYGVFSANFFKEIAKSYLKKEFELNTEVFVVKDVVGSKHHANDLHFDVKNTLKFFIYLTDTTRENGAFYCTPGSHRWTQNIRKKSRSAISYENREFTRKLSDEFGESIPIEGKAGTLIIFDTDVFHKAGTVSNGERKVMRGHTRHTVLANRPTLLQRIKNKMGI